MIKYFLTLLFCWSFITSFSQDGTSSEVYTPDSVKHFERTCIYPGGQVALMKDIASNFVVPKQAIKDKVVGKIYLQIIVDTSGVANGKILKGLRADVDSAAIDMTRKLKLFVPAIMDERKVPMTLNVPLRL
jgi:outer membrane biosynthesis protein TonB